MDQKRIGAFIAQCRKEKNLTQMQLAELLEITNQAVSILLQILQRPQYLFE